MAQEEVRVSAPDPFSKEQRSRIMSRIKDRDTGPEIALRRAMFAVGLRGWRCHRSGLPGRPDAAFGRALVALFVDGGFWHGHPSKFKPGKSGRFWDEKIRQNRRRDAKANKALRALGWRVIRLWDFEVLGDPHKAALRVKVAVDARRGPC